LTAAACGGFAAERSAAGMRYRSTGLLLRSGAGSRYRSTACSKCYKEKLKVLRMLTLVKKRFDCCEIKKTHVPGSTASRTNCRRAVQQAPVLSSKCGNVVLTAEAAHLGG